MRSRDNNVKSCRAHFELRMTVFIVYLWAIFLHYNKQTLQRFAQETPSYTRTLMFRLVAVCCRRETFAVGNSLAVKLSIGLSLCGT